jgi:hypothetical protein
VGNVGSVEKVVATPKPSSMQQRLSLSDPDDATVSGEMSCELIDDPP